MALSNKALDLIIAFEVGGKASYEENWSRPIWPGASSGVTIGIGYDLGYATNARFLSDWKGRLPFRDVQLLEGVVGLKGAEAKLALATVRTIEIPWDIARSQFTKRTLPHYMAVTARAFPGSVRLQPDSFGALVSLVYNRGASMNGDRRREMREIRKSIVDGNFELVPGLIRAMKRLWVGTSIEKGMAKRREAEAKLFEVGLEGLSIAPNSRIR